MTIKRRDFLLSGGGIAAGLAASQLAAPETASAQAPHTPTAWQSEADVVVIGSGSAGLPAAIVAREAGASVILVEAEKDIGGHAITSGGNVPLGGGTSVQKKYGINDSPDLLFRDLTDWSVVEGNGFPDYRYNDREIIRAFADNSAPTFEWLVAHGVVFVDKAPDEFGGTSVGNSVPREMHSAVMNWPMVQTGKPADPMIQKMLSSGNGLMRPLEAAARKAGVQILLEHKMTAIYREQPGSGRVIGIAADNNGQDSEHPRPQGRHHRYRRIHRQRQFPAHVRSAADRGILRLGRHAMVEPGRQRRTRRYGDRRLAVGFLQSDRRIRLQPDQARHDRQPVRLRQSEVDARQPSLRPRARLGPARSPTGRTSFWST